MLSHSWEEETSDFYTVRPRCSVPLFAIWFSLKHNSSISREKTTITTGWSDAMRPSTAERRGWLWVVDVSNFVWCLCYPKRISSVLEQEQIDLGWIWDYCSFIIFHQHHENFCLWRCSAMAHISAKRWARSTWPWDGAEVRNRVWTPRWDPKMESHGRKANRRSRCEDFSGSKWMQVVQMPAGILCLFGPRCGWWCIPIWRSQSLKFTGIVPTIWRSTCFCSVLGGFIFFILIFHRKYI